MRTAHRRFDDTGIARLGGEREHRVAGVLAIQRCRHVTGCMSLHRVIPLRVTWATADVECDRLADEHAKFLLGHS